MPEARTVSEILSSISDSNVQGRFNLDLYSRAFQEFPHKAREFLVSGSDSLVLRLENGNILKISKRELTPEMGTRSFDIPIFERGTRPGIAQEISWFVQPEGKGTVSIGDFQTFLSRIRQEGYRFRDPGVEQLGYYKGEARLLDPFSVAPIEKSQ